MSTDRHPIVDSFRAHGLRYTPQRYIVFEYLQRHPTHLTAEQIVRAVNRHSPEASRATVYNSLHALVRAGMVREVALAGHISHFECRMEQHHHFVCDTCGGIENLDWFNLPGVVKRAKVAPDRVREWELVLHGVCESCATHK